MNEEIYTKQKWAIAYHEAGHVLGFRLAGTKIKEATILPSRHYDGHVVANEYTKIEDGVVCDCLGHAAEVEFGVYNGWGGHGSDYEHAEERLKDPIKWARSKAWALAHGYVHEETTYYEYEGEQHIRDEAGKPKFLYNRFDFRLGADYRDWRKVTRIAKKDWKPEFDRLVRKARRLAKKHHAYIQQVAELLMQHNTLTDDQIPQLQEGRNRRPCRDNTEN